MSLSQTKRTSELPLPVARLALRSRNAKSSKDRHDTAWYAWEVSIKLAVAAAPPADVAKLARGTIGTWRAALRPGERPLTEPALQKLFELLAKEGEVAKPQRSMPTPAAFLDALVAYRNRVLGHGATREPAFYEQAAETLLSALEPAWRGELFLPREAQLVYCEAIVLGADGSRLGRILDLSGPDALVDDPRGSAVPATLLPRRLYLRSPTGWRALHPWLVYREGDSREREALYCFNGLGPTLAEYLDYASGETLRNEALEADWPGIVAELRKLFPATTSREAEPAHTKDVHRLGDYVILGKLGHGGMGEVYLARQEPLGRLVALKTLSRERAQDQVAVARFRQEMKALARSEHPSVVKILGSGESDGVWYYAMEYVVGADLERVARALSTSDDFERAVTSACEAVHEERKELFGDVPAVRQPRVEQHKGARRYKDLARFFRDAARGLHHLHEKGVLHRDVKPSNLMVTATGHRAVVMDLGVAAVEGSTISVAHDRSRIVGTLRYIAPEQLQRSLVEVDRRADVYSLGASLYELLCDRPFFDGDTEARLIQQVLKEEPRSIDRGVPEDLARIVRKATDKDPAQRYETAEALAQDLENFLAGMPVSARDPELGYLIRKWVERNRPLALAIVASVLLLAATLTITSARVAAKNKELEAFNTALKIKTSEAEHNAAEARDQTQRADDEAETARENAQRALESEKLAIARADDVLRLSALQTLEDLTNEADRLWPAHPANISAYEAWIEAAGKGVADLPLHRAKRAELRAKALPQSAEERRAERESHPDYPRWVELEGELSKAAEAAASATSEEDIAAAGEKLVTPEEERNRLGARLEERRDWTFPEEEREARWWNNQLTKLIEGLEELKRGLLSEDGTTEDHGWSVPKRLTSARTLEAGFAPEGEQAQAWWAALPEIRAAYPGLSITLQLGLVPIGPDPESNFWEFAHLETGEPAVRGADGKLVLKEETGLVFVLLPGGTFQMGAQKSDPNGANYDPQATGNGGPVHAVTLSAFFLSKYEMTQGQWERFVGTNPSYIDPGSTWGGKKTTLIHPVEQVSWPTCLEAMDRLGLSLPSEAQWEYGARAGTRTVWWTGNERSSLVGAVNLADQAAQRDGQTWPDIKDWPELDDGYTAHAPVNAFLPNAFGLHNVHGNVWEWCLDGYDGDFYKQVRTKDPVSPPEGSSNRVHRGGCFNLAASFARSAVRYSSSPSFADFTLGLRPARTIAP